MNKLLLIIICACLTGEAAMADVIAQWNFNSTPADNNTSTGSLLPNAGAGSVYAVGGASASFATGSSDDSAASVDNSALNIGSFPSQGTGNKTRGLQVNLSTRGYENIAVSWEQRASSTLSRYFRFQYSSNGTDFIDQKLITLSTSNTFLVQTNWLGTVAGARDNPSFAFRVVSEFESTAVGGTNTNYVAVGATYSTAGVTRFDMLTIYGTRIPGGNTAPSMSPLSSLTTRVDTASSANSFHIGDAESGPDNLVLSGASSDSSLVNASGIIFSGSGSNRTVSVHPQPGQTGAATITVTVSDQGGLSASNSFVLTVLPANTPPTITRILPQFTAVGTTITGISFTIGDLETPAGNLVLSATSGNQSLVPAENLSFSGRGSNRFLSITPANGQTGVAIITVTASDGAQSAGTTFPLDVTPSPGAVLYEPFNYSDGNILTVAGGLWNNHGGNTNETTITGGQIEVSSINTEDIDAPLRGAPFTNQALYVRMKLTVVALPSDPAGTYFAHFNSSSSFRCRLFATTLNAQDGSFRFGIANATNYFTQLERDLSPGTSYTVVLRYLVANGVSTLWVDPASESDTGVTAADLPNPASIKSFSFRQALGFGIIDIDELTIATSFAALGGAAPIYALAIGHTADAVTISWPTQAREAGYILESSSILAPADWSAFSQTPVSNGGNLVITLPQPQGVGFFRLRK